jgi:hypothetical protein
LKSSEKCNNCAQFQGNIGSAQSPCTIFPGKNVVAAGWCMSWVKSPLEYFVLSTKQANAFYAAPTRSAPWVREGHWSPQATNAVE